MYSQYPIFQARTHLKSYVLHMRCRLVYVQSDVFHVHFREMYMKIEIQWCLSCALSPVVCANLKLYKVMCQGTFQGCVFLQEWFNKTTIHATPRMAADKEAIVLSRVHMY